jgi:hypothetical protein
MSEPIDFYVNMLAGNMAGLSAVGALKSLDDGAAKATARIQELEAAQRKASAEMATIKAPPQLQALEAKLASVTAAKSAAFAKGDIARLSDLGKQKIALEEKVAKAREAATAKATKQEEKIAKLAEKVAGARGDQARRQRGSSPPGARNSSRAWTSRWANSGNWRAPRSKLASREAR